MTWKQTDQNEQEAHRSGNRHCRIFHRSARQYHHKQRLHENVENLDPKLAEEYEDTDADDNQSVEEELHEDA